MSDTDSSSPSHTSIEINEEETEIITQSDRKQLHQDTVTDGLTEQPADSGPVLCFWDYCFLFSKEFWYSLWLSLWNWPIFLLIIAMALSFVIGITKHGLKHGWYDGGAILLPLFILTTFSSIFDYYRKILKEKKKNKLGVIVERGKLNSDVKEGDIIHLKADGVLKGGEQHLDVVDGVINPNIDPDPRPFPFACSVVEHGKGVNLETLLQSRVNKSNETLGMIWLVLFVLIRVAQLPRLFRKGHETDYKFKPAIKGNVTLGIIEIVLQRIFVQYRWTGISFSVGAFLSVIIGLQHGMPLSIFISLSRWAKRITSYGVKSQNLSACGTMGLVSVIGIDITAGDWLSYAHIEIHQFWIGGIKFISGMELHPHVVEGLVQALSNLCFSPNNYSVHFREILFQFWASLGLDIQDSSLFRSNQSPIRELVSESENSEANLHSHYYGDDAFAILSRCSHYYDNNGTIHDMKNRRVLFQNVIHNMIVKGLRPIAFARVDTNHHPHFEGGLKLLGFVGLRYSFDQEIKTAVNDLKDVGMRIVLTSEDEISVATTMAVNLNHECGLNRNQVIEGVKFKEKMEGTEKEKNELMNSITLMAKAAPEDKPLLLQKLKDSGHVVAFLGTDAQTLREADVGITLKNCSSEAARTNCDLIIAAPTSLIKIIRCGRCIYRNIQKYNQAQYTSTISGLLLTLVCNIVYGSFPLAAIYLLLLPFIICLLGIQLMLINFNDEEVKSITVVGERDRSLITKLMMMKIAIHVLTQVLLFSLLEYAGLKVFRPSMEENVRHTFIFITFILWQICNLLCTMGLVTNTATFCKAVLRSPLFLFLLDTVLTMLVIVIEIATKYVNGVKLSAGQWAICFLVAAQRLTLEWPLSVLSTLLIKFTAHVNFTWPRPFSSITDCWKFPL